MVAVMTDRGPLESPAQVAVRVGELTDAAWVLSAMASVLTGGMDVPLRSDDPAGRVLVSYGFFEEAADGLVPTPACAQALGDRAERSRTASAARSAKPRRRRSGGPRKQAGLHSATRSCWRRAACRRWAAASPPPSRCPCWRDSLSGSARRRRGVPRRRGRRGRAGVRVLRGGATVPSGGARSAAPGDRARHPNGGRARPRRPRRVAAPGRGAARRPGRVRPRVGAVAVHSFGGRGGGVGAGAARVEAGRVAAPARFDDGARRRRRHCALAGSPRWRHPAHGGRTAACGRGSGVHIAAAPRRSTGQVGARHAIRRPE